MPVVPPSTSAPYDTAGSILNLARAIANDAALSIAGNLLADNQPYTFVLLNSAWRGLQDQLMNAGINKFDTEAVISGIPVAGSQDPATQCWLGYDGFFDGVSTFDTPVLPSDMKIPLKLMERQSGTIQQFIPMGQTSDGLSCSPKVIWLREWEWRDDRIYLIGATQLIDIRLRYSHYLPDLNVASDKVPIIECSNALAYYLVAVFAGSRGSPLAQTLNAKGDLEAQKIITYYNHKSQRAQHRRIPYGRQSHGGWGWW